MNINQLFTESATAGVVLSLIAYGAGIQLKKKTGSDAANPLLISIILCVAFLTVFHIDYESYRKSAQYLSYLLTPATVALAIPLYKQLYLLKENFESIPNELYSAAKVDGTSDLKYLLRVMIPIAQPTIVTIVILKVIECWNSYVWPRLITYDQNYFLVSNGIQQLRESGFGRENTPAMMAAVVVISLPLIALFLVFRKKIMAGVSRGGTKG